MVTEIAKKSSQIKCIEVLVSIPRVRITVRVVGKKRKKAQENAYPRANINKYTK